MTRELEQYLFVIFAQGGKIIKCACTYDIFVALFTLTFLLWWSLAFILREGRKVEDNTVISKRQKISQMWIKGYEYPNNPDIKQLFTN